MSAGNGCCRHGIRYGRPPASPISRCVIRGWHCALRAAAPSPRRRLLPLPLAGNNYKRGITRGNQLFELIDCSALIIARGRASLIARIISLISAIRVSRMPLYYYIPLSYNLWWTARRAVRITRHYSEYFSSDSPMKSLPVNRDE